MKEFGLMKMELPRTLLYLTNRMGLYQIFHPEVFQGHLRKKNYFEGWYLKHCSGDQGHVMAVIPGIAMNSNDSHAFIQIIDGISGETHYVPYPLDAFHWDRRKFEVRVGDSGFSLDGVSLDIKSEAVELTGKVAYSDPVSFPGSLISPGIMGWYSYVPFMECYHGIVSANHGLEGSLNFNQKEINFSGGKGYIEKDWGTSFPEAWIWLQCNHFPTSEASLFVSIAKIPWLGKFFMGFIAFLYLDGKFHMFSTYNRSGISRVFMDGDHLFIELKRKSSTLRVSVRKHLTGELKAPHTGNMSRRIKESIDSEVEVSLLDGNKELVFQETGRRAGLEIEERIFEYL